MFRMVMTVLQCAQYETVITFLQCVQYETVIIFLECVQYEMVITFLRASQKTLIDIYKLFCRSVLEFGAPVWSGALTVKNKQDIERVQKTAMRIIAGSYYTPYEQFLDDVEEDTLAVRRDKLCLNFAKKCLKTDKFSCWFPKGVGTRSGPHFFEMQGENKRFSNSAIPHLTRLLNSNKVQ